MMSFVALLSHARMIPMICVNFMINPQPQAKVFVFIKTYSRSMAKKQLVQ